MRAKSVQQSGCHRAAGDLAASARSGYLANIDERFAVLLWPSIRLPVSYEDDPTAESPHCGERILFPTCRSLRVVMSDRSLSRYCKITVQY